MWSFYCGLFDIPNIVCVSYKLDHRGKIATIKHISYKCIPIIQGAFVANKRVSFAVSDTFYICIIMLRKSESETVYAINSI